MDASSFLPPELFEQIVTFLSPTVAVCLESVCKTWNTILKNQKIWQVLSSCNLAKGLKPLGSDDYRTLVLKCALVANNMTKGRCVVRSITGPQLNTGFKKLHHAPICQNETYVLGFINLDTWECRQLLDDQRPGLMTKNYIAVFYNETPYNYIDRILLRPRTTETNLPKNPLMRTSIPLGKKSTYSVSCDIYDRSDLQNKRTITIKVSSGEWVFAKPNGEHEDDSMYIRTVEDTLIIDLKDGSIRPIPEPLDRHNNEVVLHEHHLIRYNKVHKELDLEIIDVRDSSLVRSEKANGQYMCTASKDRILLYREQVSEIDWILKDFQGKVICQCNLQRKITSDHMALSIPAIINGNIIAIVRQYSRVVFFSALTGDFLYEVNIDNFYASELTKTAVQLFAVGVGKFILSCGVEDRLIDFESMASA